MKALQQRVWGSPVQRPWDLEAKPGPGKEVALSTLLSPEEIAAGLARLEGWSRSGDEITRTFTMRSFPAALVFANAVGHLAERVDHHPDILIQYRKVTLALSTHSAGGLTGQDFDLAAQINDIA